VLHLNDDLTIEDFEIAGAPPVHVQKEATKILARWLIRHWLKNQKRKALIFHARGVSCKAHKNSRLKGGLPS